MDVWGGSWAASWIGWAQSTDSTTVQPFSLGLRKGKRKEEDELVSAEVARIQQGLRISKPAPTEPVPAAIEARKPPEAVEAKPVDTEAIERILVAWEALDKRKREDDLLMLLLH